MKDITISIEDVDQEDVDKFNEEMNSDLESTLDEMLYRCFSEDWDIDFEDISVESE